MLAHTYVVATDAKKVNPVNQKQIFKPVDHRPELFVIHLSIFPEHLAYRSIVIGHQLVNRIGSVIGLYGPVSLREARVQVGGNS